jgi:hypothetical protein
MSERSITIGIAVGALAVTTGWTIVLIIATRWLMLLA